MTGILLFVLLIGAYFVVRWVIAWATGKGINAAGDALGKSLTANRAAPAKVPAASEWVVTLTKPPAEVRAELETAGLADHSDRVETPSGVLVELYDSSGAPGLVCSWSPVSGQKPTAIIADVLRIVRQVDPGAQVVL
jgi:hypothetical protein